MILVAASLPKSASGWWFNLANELVASNGGHDTRVLGSAWPLRRVVTGPNCRIGSLRARRLLPLLASHAGGKRFTVKTHAVPTGGLRAAVRVGAARVTFNVRDPRDVALSLLEHAERGRAKRGRIDEAGRDVRAFETLDDAVGAVASFLPLWTEWSSVPSAHIVRYEDLIADPEDQLQRLADLLELDVAPDELARVVQAVGTRSDDTGLHLNVGVAGRFRTELSTPERARCEERLRPLVLAMGYEPAQP